MAATEIEGRRRVPVLGVPIDAVRWDEALARVARWADARESRVICICNVHSVVTASRDGAFGAVVRACDMATPDGAPVAWMLRRMGVRRQPRVNGPDLMWRSCGEAAAAGRGVYLYGGSQSTLDLLCARLRSAYPSIDIAGAVSPPFRQLTAEEDATEVERINASGAGLLFVGLGCPKQEHWMDDHRGRVQAAMIGVGAAFDYHAGTLPRAPAWMQRFGLEWAHRLAHEPRRLWKRYLVTNTLFTVGAIRQLVARARS